ncbi:hypothetical protein HPB48_015088 [Haemaphysalis longicornis]|uniref:Uncharacterized protein n=1 Tax=Haemaphysalis longicornis TaxID=44386 RepID=A0A9J6G8S3_HAELO|nr:hypothetical protein HPB48_015088 [Haemaphysalis longicornis]
MRNIHSKRVMYKHISKEILQSTGIYRTATQCESRFKTIAKRMKNQYTHNRTSGQTRCQVSYEEEFAQIRAADDSIEPEVLRGVHSVTYKSASKPTEEASTSSSTTAPTESIDHSSSEPLDDSASEATDNAGNQQRKRMNKDEAGRPNAVRMRHMEYFFERMEKLNQEREAKKDEREKRREERHLELVELHRDHIAALKDLAAKADT